MLLAGRGQRKRMRWLLPFMRGNTSSLLSADAQALPLKAASVGLVWSNLMLHWAGDPLAAFRELHRVLDVGGLLMFVGTVLAAFPGRRRRDPLQPTSAPIEVEATVGA